MVKQTYTLIDIHYTHIYIANYISRTTLHTPLQRPANVSWTSGKIPKIASGLFHQATLMNWLDDKTIFNWGRTDADIADDIFFYLDKSGISGRSRSGSVSESESVQSRPRSRNSSFSSSSSTAGSEGFKVEGMTPTLAEKNGVVRRIFRMGDGDDYE